MSEPRAVPTPEQELAELARRTERLAPLYDAAVWVFAAPTGFA